MNDKRRSYAFWVTDVFAERRFGGNQLAVFPAGGTKLVLEERLGAIDLVVQDTALGYHARLSIDGNVELPQARPDVLGSAHPLSLPAESIVEAWFAAKK